MAMAIAVHRPTEATENRALKTAFSTKTWTKRMATKTAAAETNPIRLRPTTAKYDPTRNGANGLAEAGQSLVSWTRGLDQRKEAANVATTTTAPQLASANHAMGRQRLDWSCPVGNNSSRNGTAPTPSAQDQA